LVLFEGVAKGITRGVASDYTLHIFSIILRERKTLIVKDSQGNKHDNHVMLDTKIGEYSFKHSVSNRLNCIIEIQK